MKRLILALLLLLLASLACKTVLPQSGAATQIAAAVVWPSPTESLLATSTPRSAPPPVTCTDDSCLNSCLRRINQTLPTNIYEPLTGVYAEDNIDLNLVYYKVEEGQLGEPQILYVPDDFRIYQEDLTAHENVWMYASSLLPPEQLKWITGFEIFSSSSYSGWVSPTGTYQDDRSHWILGIDIVYAQDPVALTYTLVHEYGHLITLNTDQVLDGEYYYGWDQDAESCSEFLSPNGCSKPDSYLNLFYEEFWKGDIYEEWLREVEKQNVDSSDEFRALVEQFYEKYPEQFTREYAATNIHEDIAESFEHFVLEPKPSRDGVVAQKIRFFYDFPELIELRQAMIQNICSYTQ